MRGPWLVVVALCLSGFTVEPEDVSGWSFVRSLPIGASLHGVGVAHDPLPTRSGKTSLRFEVRPGDCSTGRHGWDDCRQDRERAELKQQGYQRHGETWWYRFSLFVPEDHRNIWPAKLSFAQFHQQGAKPVLMLQNHKGGLWLDIRNGKRTVRRVPIIPERAFKGRWHDIRFNIRWSRNRDGFMRTFIGDELVHQYKGRTMSADRVYFKFGLYRSHVSRSSRAGRTTHTAFYDLIERSETPLQASPR